MSGLTSDPTNTATPALTRRYRYANHIGLWSLLDIAPDEPLPVLQVSAEVKLIEGPPDSSKSPQLQDLISFLPTNKDATKRLQVPGGALGLFLPCIVDGNSIEETYLVTANMVDDTKEESAPDALTPGHLIVTAYPGIAEGNYISRDHELFPLLVHHILRARNRLTLPSLPISDNSPPKYLPSGHVQCQSQVSLDLEEISETGNMDALSADQVPYIQLEVNEAFLAELSQELEPPERREKICRSVRHQIKVLGDRAICATDPENQREGDEADIVHLIRSCMQVTQESRCCNHIRAVMITNMDMVNEMTKDLELGVEEYYAVAVEACIHGFGVDAIMTPEEYKRAEWPLRKLDTIIRHSMEPLLPGEPIPRPTYWEIEYQTAVSYIMGQCYQQRPETGPLTWRRIPTDHFRYYASDPVYEQRLFTRYAINTLAINSLSDFDLREIYDDYPPDPQGRKKLASLMITLPASCLVRPRDENREFEVLGEETRTSIDGTMREFSVVGRPEPVGPEDPDFDMFMGRVSRNSYPDGSYDPENFNTQDWALLRHKYSHHITALSQMARSALVPHRVDTSDENDHQMESEQVPSQTEHTEQLDLSAPSPEPPQSSPHYSPHSSIEPLERAPSWDDSKISFISALDCTTYGVSLVAAAAYERYPSLDENYVRPYSQHEHFTAAVDRHTRDSAENQHDDSQPLLPIDATQVSQLEQDELDPEDMDSDDSCSDSSGGELQYSQHQWEWTAEMIFAYDAECEEWEKEQAQLRAAGIEPEGPKYFYEVWCQRHEPGNPEETSGQGQVPNNDTSASVETDHSSGLPQHEVEQRTSPGSQPITIIATQDNVIEDHGDMLVLSAWIKDDMDIDEPAIYQSLNSPSQHHYPVTPIPDLQPQQHDTVMGDDTG
ncbi:hypothetical protein C8J56DRAFT_1057947 [Mycena floridula]|nr:hypothetical protein C8J56DRAFT_1057947 [Mycena floridula]